MSCAASASRRSDGAAADPAGKDFDASLAAGIRRIHAAADKTATRLRIAFPIDLRADVDFVLRQLPDPDHSPTPDDIGTVTVHSERVRIPYRVYLREVDLTQVGQLGDTQQRVLACIYTRNHEGRVRESALRRLLPPAEVFVAPFIVQLVGEYVVEIVEIIREHIDELQAPEFCGFLRENGPFLSRTRQRATSYWDCYYRDPWRSLADYPGMRVLDALGALAS